MSNVGLKVGKLTVIEDLDNNRILSKPSVCALEEIIKIITKREKEQTLAPIDIPYDKKYKENFTPEFIHQIQKDILGWDGTY